MHSYRRKSRASLLPLIQMLSLVLVFALPVMWASRVYTSSPEHFSTIVVKPGDTVWTLVAKRAEPGTDINQAAYEVLLANHLEPGSQLHPGQALRVPQKI